MSHWANQYINKPWARGAKGPDSYDCLGLVSTVLANHYKISLDLDISDWDVCNIKAAINSQNSLWASTDLPQDGDVVLMARSRFPCHIGIIIRVDCLRCLHCLEPTKGSRRSTSGVIAQRLQELGTCGWGHTQFYRRIP